MLDILVSVASALFTPQKTRLQEWRESDSPTLRIVGTLIVVGIVLLIGFLIFWFFIRN